ncbi:TetR/AcrR family transcriptional regulator [Pseudoduganella albidiflava]|uniref:TetR family transcriptional regulator n=1 Tax=Pseudoduganella albidiflava TaxID=321983 RepID=A0A411WS79_9BURK|nr:TetR/AcrR family transcriptional regulator [Pseudoduganella albidiflava]QBH99640.1 TetR/AcrR family transcriptional regulator [Pseudoduganella albidiflava]GGY46434.1 TetR family transcriptional regulator [Pseudoduganella albidiflava]
MRYDADHKQSTRARIVESAAKVLRRDGIATTGVASLMAEAGLTNGAFYAHFDSKEALVAEAVVAALQETGAVFARKIREAAPGQGLDALVNHYLDPRHVTYPERGCAVAALGPELARRPDATRAFVGQAIDELVAIFADALPAGHRDAMAVARAVFASLVGTIQLARTCDPSLIPVVLEAGAIAARTIGQLPGAESQPAQAKVS